MSVNDLQLDDDVEKDDQEVYEIYNSEKDKKVVRGMFCFV